MNRSLARGAALLAAASFPAAHAAHNGELLLALAFAVADALALAVIVCAECVGR